MKEPFPHDIRAVLSAPGKALSLKQIFAATVFLLAGYVCYVVFTYMALLYDGVRMEYIWQSYGFFPLKPFAFDSAVALVIQAIGGALGLVGVSQAIMAVAVINFEEMRGDYFFSTFDAIRFAFGRTPTLILGYVTMAAFVAFIYVLGLIVGLIGRVPYIGELVVSVFYVVPIFITLVFTVFIIFVGTVAVVLLPVIIASQKEKEVFGSLLQLFAVVIREPIRFFWYLAVSSVLAKLASFVMAYLFYRTIQFSRLMLGQGGGEKIERLFNSAYAMLPVDSPAVSFVTTIFPGVAFGFSFMRWGYGIERTPAAVILAIAFFSLFAVILGYMTAVVSTGLARGYAVIRRMKDDYLIVEEKPLMSHEDHANPPLRTEEEES